MPQICCQYLCYFEWLSFSPIVYPYNQRTKDAEELLPEMVSWFYFSQVAFSQDLLHGCSPRPMAQMKSQAHLE
jgi:hypothetical protein